MRKICVVSTNRSDYSRLKSVIKAIENRDDLKLVLIVAASHLLEDFGYTINSIKQDGFKIDAITRMIIEGEDPVAMAKSVGLGAIEMPTLLSLYDPDIVLVVGDRFDILPAVISAAMMNIHIAHIQGGEVTGTIDESIRHAITKFSHIHFPSNEESAERIRRLGEREDMIFSVGCPSFDYFKDIGEVKYEDLDELNKKYGINIDFSKPYILFIQHPVTSEYEQSKAQIIESLEAINETKLQALMIYPNVDAGSAKMISGIRRYEDKGKYPQIFMQKHIEFNEYIKLLNACACIVGNSSSGIRESCFFGTPAVNIGTRQNGRQRGNNVIDTPHKKVAILEAIQKSVQHGKYEAENIYGNGQSGQTIAEILATIKLPGTQKKILY